ncbi:flagellin [Neorhizobium sp. P12A]|uniref:flagellin N-terminal helical domain-containing protein n=1 Tax=Neorhizobium sp. P12A TaxID=2268027 RepID=UPI00104D4AA0|nr:flagellin [Neorhizobium sp. P12A]KAA0700065.1 flagellin [Neorhizobium sp. P12A]
MSSTVTSNAFTLGALVILRGVNKDLDTVEKQVSSNLRIQTAADDPSYWSMATTMRSDTSTLSTIGDALSLGAAKVDTAYTGLTSAIDVVTKIQSLLVSAKSPGVDKDQMNVTLGQYEDQLNTITQAATISGENWLYNDDQNVNSTKTIVSNFVRGTDGSVSLATVNYDATPAVLIDTVDPSRGLFTKDIDASQLNPDGASSPARNYYLLAATGGTPPADGTAVTISNSTSDDQMSDMISVVDSILKQLTSSAADLGVVSKRVDEQSTFVSQLGDTVTQTVGNLVDTDMDEASSRVSALTAAQQMAVQSVSMANTMASKILILLQGK